MRYFNCHTSLERISDKTIKGNPFLYKKIAKLTQQIDALFQALRTSTYEPSRRNYRGQLIILARQRWYLQNRLSPIRVGQKGFGKQAAERQRRAQALQDVLLQIHRAAGRSYQMFLVLNWIQRHEEWRKERIREKILPLRIINPDPEAVPLERAFLSSAGYQGSPRKNPKAFIHKWL